MKSYKLGTPKRFIENLSDSDKPIDPIIRDAFERIWEMLQQNVFLWETFKTDLPFGHGVERLRSGAKSRVERTRKSHQEDLQAMCFDDNGRRRRLSREQQEDIAENGRFTVKSTIHERYDNVWLLGSFLQLGRRESRRKFEHRIGRADRYWHLELPKALSSDAPSSIWHAFRNIKNGCVHLFSILFGVPEYRPRYSDRHILTLTRYESLNFLFSDCQPSHEDELLWTGPDGVHIDVALVNPDVKSRLTELVKSLSESLAESGDLLDSSLLQALVGHPEVATIHPNLPRMLRRLHELDYRLSPEHPRYQELLKETLDRREQRLINDFPHRGRYPEWREEQLDSTQEAINAEVISTLAEEVDASLEKGQEKFSLHQLRLFYRQHSPKIRGRLEGKFRSAKVIKLQRLVWSIASSDALDRLDITRTRFGTDRAFWRLRHLGIYTWHLFSDSCLRLLRAFLHHPMGIRYVATLSREPFQGELWIDRDGELKKTGPCSTHITHLYRHIDLIRKRRREFENKSDYGLFPRGVGRLFNRAYCYLLIGVLGIPLGMALRYTAFLFFIMLLGLGLILTPLWAPLAALVAYFGSILVYDRVGPMNYYEGRAPVSYSRFAPLPMTLLNQIVFRGVVGAALKLFAILFYALAKPVLQGLALMLFVLRRTWDGATRYLFIRPFARIPGANFPGLVTRISGNGIAREILDVRTRAEVADLYHCTLEHFVLGEYEALLKNTLYQPREILDQIMTPLYCAILHDHLERVKHTLDEHIRGLKMMIEKTLSPYRQEINAYLEGVPFAYIRLKEDDMEAFYENAESLTRTVIGENLLHYMSGAQVAAFWAQRNVPPEGWPELTRRLLERWFSREIFTPIEACDDSIQVRNNNETMAQSLLLSGEPSTKVAFNVIGTTGCDPIAQRLFRDNGFWRRLNHPFYLPIDNHNEWEKLERLRTRRLADR